MANEDLLDRAYEDIYASNADKLPRDRHAITAHNRALKAAAAAQKDRPLDRSVRDFAEMLQTDSVIRMLVTRMITEVPKEHRTVETVQELLEQLNQITVTAPEWEEEKAKRVFFPMSALFTYMMMTTSGMAVMRMPRMNDALRGVLRAWCRYLDSDESAHVLNDGTHGWFQGHDLPRDSEAFKKSAWHYNALDEYEIDLDKPHGGFEGFNDFFHRQIKPSVRPFAGDDNPRCVVSPNDGTIYKVARDVAPETTFWIKNQPYSLHDMLNHDPVAKSFKGGDVLQSYLQGSDYHRWHAPVSGRIVKVEVVEGLMFSNLASEGNDISGVGSQGYYTSVNTRGLCFIEADHKPLGLVCVMPIGITEISSIRHTVKVGDHVGKGDQLGLFSYGGSSLATIFQPGAIEYFTVCVPDDPKAKGTLKVNAQMAVAN
ncbi:MAG: phophatidylserine decarboxylase associated domain-containing protein [Pseudomonadota bacterium]